MPNLKRFADLARKVGVVAPVAPVRSSGDTDKGAKYTQQNQVFSNFVAPVAPVARTNNEGWDEADWQAAFEERAGILEFDEGLPRTVAEKLASEQVFRL